MAALDTAAVSAFTDGQALSALLATEGFLLAAVALAVNLDAPGQPRGRDAVVAFRTLAISAGVVLGVAAIGALVAWSRIFVGGEFGGFSRALVAGCLVVPIVAQPVIALLLALGSKSS